MKQHVRRAPGRFSPAVAWHPRRLALLTTLTIAGHVALVASAWLLPSVSEYSLTADYISELVLGRFGVIQTIALLLAGVGTIALALAMREPGATPSGSALGRTLIAIYGAGAILTAIFPTDRVDGAAEAWSQSTTGTIHLAVSLLSFVCIIIGMFALTRTFARQTRSRTFTIWSALLSASALSLFLAQSEGPRVGLMQRLLVTAISAWLVMVAFRLRRTAAPAPVDG